MADSRWDPFGEMVSLREAMDRLLHESFVRPGSTRGANETDSFQMELGETADAYVVRAYLPGIKPEDAQITVHGDLLTIRGESQESDEREVQSWLMRERRAGAVQRSVRLPAPVDADKAEARCEHGVLVLTLPKAESAKPRRIPVSGADRPQAVAGGSAAARLDAAPNASGATATPDSLAAQRGDTRREDVVTEGSDMSFPASDPPSWTPGHTGAAGDG